MEVEDRLSQLPEEIVISILSQLTVEEAVATSPLSSRWRYLWMHVPCLNFNRPKLPYELVKGHLEFCTKEVMRYINLVNHVLDLHKCPILEEFSISFPFLQSTSSSAKCEVYKWLKFASSRKIQSLKFDLSVDNARWPRYTRLCNYSFPIELLLGSKTLKKLTLSRVIVDCQAVESLLSSCPLLEFLSIRESGPLYHLKVVGPSLKLKHLVIWKCPIFSLEIRNVVNLVSFTFRGLTYNFLFENVTSVLNIDINLTMYGLLCKHAPRIATYFSQLVMLSLVGDHSTMRRRFGGSMSTFNNLKWLMLTLNYVDKSSLLGITSLLEAAPYLQKFTMELHRRHEDVRESISSKTLKSPHKHLTEFQYRGYLGDANDVELATYLLENTVALAKFIVDPCQDVKDLRANCKETQRARDLAMLQLQPKVPKGVKLVVI